MLHFGAFLGGGVVALRTDRATRQARSEERRRAHLARLGRAHPLVMRALWVSVATGVVLFALASERYVTSGLFWIKMALFVALLANGLVMQIAERDAREALESGGTLEGAWSRIGASAVTSTVLWLGVAGAGIVLTLWGLPAHR